MALLRPGTTWLLLGLLPAAAPAGDFATERERMVKEQIIMRGISDPRVLGALGKVPREQFVPGSMRDLSYTD